MSRWTSKVYFIDGKGVKHQLTKEGHYVTHNQHGYRCTCGEGILAETMRKANQIHEFNISFKEKSK